MGRPSKLDDVILLPDGDGGQSPRIRWEVIVERIRAGIPPEVASYSTGVDESTYYRWMAEGVDRWIDGKLRRARAEYRQFREAVMRAKAEAEAIHVGRIAKASETDWKASAWYLERSRPERWRRRDTIHQAGPAEDDPPVPDRRVVHELGDDAATKLADLIELVEGASSPPPAGPGEGGPT